MTDFDASVRLAIGLAQDGMTRVTVVVARRPGVVRQARRAARAAGVEVVAERVGTASITLRFSPQHVTATPATEHGDSIWRRLRTRFATL
jgi:hypothetical protein